MASMSIDSGVAAFNERKFYEAHEHWEQVWLDAADPERRWIQGLIQVAAGFHKAQEHTVRSAVALLERGLEKLADAPEVFAGLALGAFREQIQKAREALAQSPEPFEVADYPRIEAALQSVSP